MNKYQSSANYGNDITGYEKDDWFFEEKNEDDLEEEKE